ncbi:M3 family peptidase [Puteibacter caeruleilacunae]|nr:M3 family peptidase [Puteibacter caeruleilacunae]
MTAMTVMSFNSGKKMNKEGANPLLMEFSAVHQAAPFEDIKPEHFVPAFKQRIEEAEKGIDAIVAQKEAATFDNTIIPLEEGSEKLGRLASVFFNMNSAVTSSEMQKIAQEVSPLLTAFSSKMLLNKGLYARVKTIHDKMDQLSFTEEQKTVVNNYYKDFVRNGANLNDEQKKRFVEIKTELSKLNLKFSENVLAETNAFELLITDEKDLAGIPESIREGAAMTAKSKGKEGWMFTLQYPSFVPFMKFADNRELREKMYRAYTSRGNKDNKYNNNENVKKIVNLRLELANMLGYSSYSEYVLKERMAETPKKVTAFLEDLHNASRPFAKKEYAEVLEFAKNNGGPKELKRWDWSYYSDKLKEEKYGFNDEAVKPYFKLENVSKGIFDLAHTLYGISFKEVNNIPKYHEDVKTYEVYDEKGNFLSVFYTDFFPRESKQGGAWMTDYRGQSNINGKMIRPHVSIVCNFNKPTATKPSLLTFDEVTTFLHEFGHALHGMLANATYPSVSGTSVYRDFVELPSQIMENFATEREWLDKVAVHYETGEKIPQELIDKMLKAKNYQAGYASERQLSFGMNDMAWHSITKPFKGDVVKFEKDAMSKTELFDEVKGSAFSPAFSHIFAGGYAAGYYGYKWAEVLDADAFSLFQKNGIFDKATAKSFRSNVLEKGGSIHPMILYKNFRGQEPTIEALLERSGLK